MVERSSHFWVRTCIQPIGSARRLNYLPGNKDEIGCALQGEYRWTEPGLWPEGPGKHSPGFTLGFGFTARGPEGASADEAPRSHVPECRVPLQGFVTLEGVSQGKPWATLSWPFGPKIRHKLESLYYVALLTAGQAI
jgi:hypothetical protein